MNRPGKYGIRRTEVSPAEYMRVSRAAMTQEQRDELRRKNREGMRRQRAQDRAEQLPDHVQAGMDAVLAKLRRGDF